MVEIIKYLVVYTGVAGISIYLILLLFRELFKKNIFSKLTPIHTYRTIVLISLLAFLIAISGVLIGFLKPNSSSTSTALKCTLIQECSEIRNRVLKLKSKSKVLDSDDELVLDVLSENFLKLEKMNPTCEEINPDEISQEINKTKSILLKYE